MAATKEEATLVLLREVEKNCEVKSEVFADLVKLSHDDVVSVLKGLEARNMLESKKATEETYDIKKDGRDILENGSPEIRVLRAVPDGGISMSDLQALLGKSVVKVGMNHCSKSKWLSVEKVSKTERRVVKVLSTTKPPQQQQPQGEEAPSKVQRFYEKQQFLLAFTGSLIVVYLAAGRQPLLAAAALLSGSCSLAAYRRSRAIPSEEEKHADVPALQQESEVEDTVRSELAALERDIINGSFQKLEKSERDRRIKPLKARKLISVGNRKVFRITKGPKFSLSAEKDDGDAVVTLDMIKDGSWETRQFKPYNFNAKGAKSEHGSLHPLLKVRTEFRSILLEMGFEEMPTNQYIESSFFNFDTLFQPQQHPARDAHDTFFMEKPKSMPLRKELVEYADRVRNTHENGGSSGSIGWRYNWSLEEAQKNILRTHTTAVSSRMLHKLAQEKEFRPVKYFSIDRVFRNETLDFTHLAEFHQVEGFIADRNLTLGHLIGIISKFFEKIGIPNVKFKPAYNPYTEPSMEVFGYSPVSGKWMEVGNSGIFRPEMLAPMNLPSDVRVIAWGLSLERPTMIKYGVKNIRDLFGHKVDLKMVRSNPIARF